MKEAFDLFDTQKSGKLDIRETKAAIRALGFELKNKEIRELIEEINK